MQGGEALFEGADKVGHVGLFLLLAATARWRFGRGPAVRVGLLLYAVGSEVVQELLLPDRTGDALDVVADLLGALLGWLLAGRLLRRT